MKLVDTAIHLHEMWMAHAIQITAINFDTNLTPYKLCGLLVQVKAIFNKNDKQE